MEEVSFLNDSDTNYERIGSDDILHRIVVSGFLELPFGKGRKWRHTGTVSSNPLSAVGRGKEFITGKADVRSTSTVETSIPFAISRYRMISPWLAETRQLAKHR